MDTQICTAVPEADPPTDPDSNAPRSRPALNHLVKDFRQDTVNDAGQEIGPSIIQVGDQLATIPRPHPGFNGPHWLNRWNDCYPVSYRRARENAMTVNAEPRFSIPF
jgi:hypothetical protein